MTRITEKGFKLIEKLRPDIESLGSYVATALTNAEKKILSDLLEKIYGPHI